MAYLCDAWVCALAVGARQLQPLALMDGAVLPQGALALSLAPAALEVWVRLEAQAAALAHGSALVEVNCRQRARVGWGCGMGLGAGRGWEVWTRAQPQTLVMGLDWEGQSPSSQPCSLHSSLPEATCPCQAHSQQVTEQRGRWRGCGGWAQAKGRGVTTGVGGE